MSSAQDSTTCHSFAWSPSVRLHATALTTFRFEQAVPVGGVREQRHPKLTITADRQAIWSKMKNDYEDNQSNPATLGGQLYKKAFDISASGATYFNDGLFDAWLAQVPGNRATTYCDRAWTSLGSNITAAATTNRTDGLSVLQRTRPGNAGLGGNFSREHFINYVHIYDWCYASWAQARRDQLLAKLNEMAAATSDPVASNAWRGADGDQPLGDFFAIAMLYEATKDYNPPIVTIWAQPNMGGYIASAANYANDGTSSSTTSRSPLVVGRGLKGRSTGSDRRGWPSSAMRHSKRPMQAVRFRRSTAGWSIMPSS